MRKIVIGFTLLFGMQAHADWSMQSVNIQTPWADQVTVDNVWSEYPRPQMVRPEWKNLNGLWEYAVLDDISDDVPETMDKEILVPFCIESALSGIQEYSSDFAYRRTFSVDDSWLTDGKRVLLHFGAVDWQAIVLVNGVEVGSHEGGYTAWSIDITDYLNDSDEQTLEVKVYDPTDNGGYPRGKQSLSPSGIMYTSCSGIWQTVWLESVPASYIEDFELLPDIDASTLSVVVEIGGEIAAGTTFTATAFKDGEEVATAISIAGGTAVLSIPWAELWSPDHPFLYDLSISLDVEGEQVDEIESYFGMRKIAIVTDDDGYTRTYLNNEFLFQMGPLDQGFWPEGIYTAPTDEALLNDIVMMKRWGFNTVRKHIKVEPLRWYYYCDKLGLMVWQDMPSANSYTSTTIDVDQTEFKAELAEIMDMLKNTPSIVTWVLFNENQSQVSSSFVKEVYDLAESIDPNRLISDASGYTHYGYGDYYDTHPYPEPEVPTTSEDVALANGEYGGVNLTLAGHTWSSSGWGYTETDSPEEFEETYNTYARSIAMMRSNEGMSAAIYTQLTDVETELNGLMSYDRYLKTDVEAIYESNRTAIEGYVEETDVYVLPTADIEQVNWQYTTSTPSSGWETADFDDSSWKTGKNGFGANGLSNMTYGTSWTSSDIWIRKTVEFDLTDEEFAALRMKIYYDEDCEVYLNGTLAYSETGYITAYTTYNLSDEERALLNQKGSNTIAVHCTQTSGGQFIDVGFYIPDDGEDDVHERQIDLNLQYTNSAELKIEIGYALDVDATEPEVSVGFSSFPFVDENKKTSEYTVGLQTNLLINGDDLSYDVSSLTRDLDHETPVKYFFSVLTTADGEGEGIIDDCRFVDNTTGVESIFPSGETQITSAGDTTTITVVVNVDQANIPRNLTVEGSELVWDSPAVTSLILTGYAIYVDSELVATVDPSVTYYEVDSTDYISTYAVSAVYGDIFSEMTGAVKKIDTSSSGSNADKNVVRHFYSSGFVIPDDVFSSPLSDATIEFWMNADTMRTYNQQIGVGLGTFLVRVNSSRRLFVGWENSSGNRVYSSSLSTDTWNHVGIVVKEDSLLLYLNGELDIATQSDDYSGLPEMENFTVGMDGSLEGIFDEFRIWSSARTALQIKAGMQCEIANPLGEADLIAYYKMDEVTEDSETKLHDSAGGYNAAYLSEGTHEAEVDTALLSIIPVVYMSIPDTAYYEGSEVIPSYEVSTNTSYCKWYVADLGVDGVVLDEPSFIFNESGDHIISVVAYTSSGNSVEVSDTVTVLPVDEPVVSFELPADTVLVGETVVFVNLSEGVNTSYTWTIGGESTDTIGATNATISFSEPGVYDVTLAATNPAGTFTASKQIVVIGQLEVASFKVSPTVTLKGDTIYLVDGSDSESNKLWKLSNGVNNVYIVGGNTSYTVDNTGVYSVTYTLSDGVDETVSYQDSAFFVCTAYSYDGFSVQGGESQVTFPSPFTSATTSFTVDWWMNPIAGSTTFTMGTSDDVVRVSADSTGVLTITVGTKTFTTDAGVAVMNEWHHYTVTYGSLRVNTYRDGQQVDVTVTSQSSCPAWSDFEIGQVGEGMSFCVDEVSIWDYRWDADSIAAYANYPLVSDISTSEANGLIAYYKFDDSEVLDETSNHLDGNLSGSSDSFVASLGVFALVEDPSDSTDFTDITADYLTNYTAEFLNTGEIVNNSVDDRFYELENGTNSSTWEGDIMTTEGDGAGAVYVDAALGSDFTLRTGWNGFPETYTDCFVYETITLNAGRYVFTASADSLLGAGDCYLVAVSGEELSLDDLLGSGSLSSGQAEFLVADDNTTVSVGLYYTLPTFACVTIGSFGLLQSSDIVLSANGDVNVTGIKEVQSSSPDVDARVVDGGLQLIGEGAVRVYSVDGRLVYFGRVNGTARLPLVKGVYIVNGVKLAVN